MANRREHTVTGAVVGGLANLAWQFDRLYRLSQPPENFSEAVGRINFFEVAPFSLVGGFVFACLPDVLEPANSPRHRGFFHSLTWGGGLVLTAFGEPSERWTPEGRGQARCMVLCYLSHLYLDLRTPMGLPFL